MHSINWRRKGSRCHALKERGRRHSKRSFAWGPRLKDTCRQLMVRVSAWAGWSSRRREADSFCSEGLLSDREGLLQVGGMRIRRRELREMIEESKQKHRIQMIPVAWEYVDWLLYEGFEKAKAAERKGVEEFTSWRSLFTLGKPKPMAHPVYRLLDRETTRSGAWRSLSQRLLEQPEFQSWVLERDWVEPYLKRVEDARESRLVLNEAQREERLAAIVRTAAEAIFPGNSASAIREDWRTWHCISRLPSAQRKPDWLWRLPWRLRREIGVGWAL